MLLLKQMMILKFLNKILKDKAKLKNFILENMEISLKDMDARFYATRYDYMRIAKLMFYDTCVF